MLALQCSNVPVQPIIALRDLAPPTAAAISILACLGGVLLASCQATPRSRDWIEADVKVLLLEADARDSGAALSEVPLLDARIRLVAGAEGLYVATRGQAAAFPEPEGGEDDAVEPQWVPMASTQAYLFGESMAWVSFEEAAFERQYSAEALYEERNFWRQNRQTFSSDFLRSPWLRGRAYVDWCWGDLRTRDGEAVEWEGDDASVKFLAGEPGEVWEVVLASAGSSIAAIGRQELCLAGALGITVDRARAILQRLGGMPARITSVRPLVEERRERVMVTTFRMAREASRAEQEAMRQETLPSAGVVQAAEALDQSLAHSGTILSLLSDISQGREAPPGLLTISGLCLRLSKLLMREDLPEVVDACRQAGDALIQVELARAALRVDGEIAWRELRPLVLGASALTAMNVVEALAAEAHPKALAALAQVLKKRHVYTDVGQGTVVNWALRHLRVLSQVPPSMVLESLTIALVSAEEDLEPGFDLDFWLRWLEQQRQRLPAL